MVRAKPPSRSAIQGRWSSKYLKQRKRYRSQCEVVKAPCHLCGQPIDYTVPSGEGESFEVDHFYPVDDYPELMEDIGNFRPSHKSCNASRGKAPVVPTLGTPSEKW